MAHSSPVIARIQQPIEGSSIGVEGRLASECIKASEWIEAWRVEPIVEWAEERRRKGSTWLCSAKTGTVSREFQCRAYNRVGISNSQPLVVWFINANRASGLDTYLMLLFSLQLDFRCSRETDQQEL